MNAVEIADAVSTLVEQPFDRDNFPFAFLEAFGNKETTLKKLLSGDSNKSDIGGVLQRNNIHLKVCAPGDVAKTLKALRESPATARLKAKFILATDGETIEAENLADDDEPIVCAYADFSDHFGYFLPLAGITTVKQIRESSFDIKATGRLNRLYIELLKDNPEWATAARREDLNHFMARLIFCFFAEDTDIFHGEGLFSSTVEQMSAGDPSKTGDIISELFRAMNIPIRHEGKISNFHRDAAGIRSWANVFPYVNGGLFTGSVEVPRFSRIARAYLLKVGELPWQKINPDIFGSMIQAVADDEERGALGMHYTSVPNILKVLNPLFLDELREKLAEAGNNSRKLLNLRQRIARIRVFDPACGSGNFLVIAYKQMREIEAEINRRRGEIERKSDISVKNFRGIEIRHFSCEIARLALIIAEYQCDVLHRGQQLALAEFLPLEAANWITCGNALTIDWLSVCPPVGKGVKLRSDDLLKMPLDQAEIDFQNEGGETYICGNPPYRGSKWQTAEQKADLAHAWAKHPKLVKTTDFVTGWFARFFDYADHVPDAVSAFVTTNSVCQGQQASDVWPVAFERGCEIRFAHTSFKWANLAAHNAGVTVVVLGLGRKSSAPKMLYQDEMAKQCTAIGPYLVPDSLAYVQKASEPIGEQSTMLFGNMPRDGGNLLMEPELAKKVGADDAVARLFIKRLCGSEELINGKLRYCFWIRDGEIEAAAKSSFIAQRLKLVAQNRSESPADSTRQFAKRPHRFVQIAGFAETNAIVVPKVSSESRPYLPVGFVDSGTIVSDLAFALYDAPLWNMALVASKLHLVWIATVCGKLETRYRYSNTIGWNTFPIPPLTAQNKSDLTLCAEDILLAREAHFPATIADLYDPEKMPANLRAAHERNDETLERIYIGRRFKNDTERLEKLFELYTQMTAKKPAAKKAAKRSKGGGE
jgi:hypothetical protein